MLKTRDTVWRVTRVPARCPSGISRLHDDAPRHVPASCAQRQAAPSPRAVSGTIHPQFCTACQRLTPTAVLPAQSRPPTPPASSSAPAGGTSASALAPALSRCFCEGSAALAKSPGLCSYRELPRLSPRTHPGASLRGDPAARKVLFTVENSSPARADR